MSHKELNNSTFAILKNLMSESKDNELGLKKLKLSDNREMDTELEDHFSVEKKEPEFDIDTKDFDEETIIGPSMSSNYEMDCEYIPNPISTTKKTKVVVMMGAPGSGKDSATQELLKSNNYYHLSTGNIFRKEMSKQTPLGKKIEEYMAHGNFVPDNLVTAIVFNVLNENIDRTVLLNGYPRTPNQANQLYRFADVTKVILIDTPEDVCRMRVKKRLVDSETGFVYSQDDKVPVNISDNLIRRVYDDNILNLNKRFDFYYAVLAGILVHFRDVLQVVDGTRPLKHVVHQITKKLDQLDLEQDPFCKCRINVSSQINVPCGHIVYCKDCAPKLDKDPCCVSCNESIKRYISLDIQKPLIAKDDYVKNDKYELSCQLCDPYVEDNTVNVCVSVQTENKKSHSPCNLCCVVDVSGSMGSKAKFEDTDGVTKDDGGGSVLDIVRRAVKTVIDCLTDKDTFSLVTFSNSGQILLAPTLMTSDGKVRAKAKADELHADGGTYMWTGLEKGIDALKGITGRKSILFMTDGEPSDAFDYKRLEEYAQKNKIPRVHTFGFGVGLKRGLLPDLAKCGNGINAFIPDSGVTGSTFVRLVGNICSEEALNPRLRLTVLNGAEFDGPIKNFMKDTSNEGSKVRIVNLNGLHFDQTRDVVVPLLLPSNTFLTDGKGDKFKKPYLKAELIFEEGKQLSLDCRTLQTFPRAKLALLLAEMVYELNYALNSTIPNKAPDRSIIERIIARMEACQHQHEYIKLVLNDLKGRIIKAFIPEKWKVWGYHYVAAFVRAHELQLCTSGLDTSVSIYSNILLQAYLMYGKNKFSSEENKTPTHAQQVAAGYSVPSYVPPASTYTSTGIGWGYSGGGGGSCFAELSTVETLQGSKYMKDVVPGDVLRVDDGFAAVKYVAEIRMESEILHFHNGLRITPTHPIRAGGKWHRAREMNGASTSYRVDRVYNLVLDRSHVLLVNGFECITWGHDFTDSQIAHPFYGSSKRIEEELSKLSKDGVAKITGLIRDENDHVTGFC